MSTHRYIDRICCIVLAVTIVITVLFMCGENIGITNTARAMGYETKLFDTSKVHTIDIIIDDWDGFLETCTDEEYTSCAVKIDNEAFKNVAIRAKGNTSLSQVSSYDSSRYSFKIEFDHYDSNKSYHGLDKLCLNNIIQDNTYMKDYLCYQMMSEFGVDSPLCSYVYITVNGEDWGLYLAVEGVEDSFLERNYGNDSGELYKPDSQSMGGGKGNGENFDMNEFSADNETAEDSTKAAGNEAADNETQDTTELTSQNISTQFTATDNTQDGASDKGGGGQGMNSDFGQGGGFGGGNGMGGTPPTGDNNGGGQQGEMPDFSPNGSDGGTATDDKSSVTGQNDGAAQGTAPDSSQSNDSSTTPDENKTADENSSSDNSGTNAPEIPSGDNMNDRGGGMGGGDMGGGMSGSDDVSLIYTDDEYSSYENIFNNAKTDITDEDKDRLIASLKKLNANEDISDVVNVEEVIRYFVVHNFVCNFDSYTGSMIHNYYLYEKDGQMSMIPWDYNLAFGGFMGSQDASSLINYPIDTPVSSGTVDSRPMLAWIFASDEYTELYHSLFSEFIEEYFDNDYIPNLIKETEEMISSYVEKDPTKFCTYEEFESGVDALWSFCVLRAESISGQLDGTIPSTSDGQSADSSTLISAGDLNISDMGTMNVGNNDNNMQMPENGFATMSMGDGSQTADGSSNQNVPDKPSGTQSDSDSADNSDSFSLAGNFDGSPPDLPDSDNSGQQPTSDGSSITTDSQDSDGAASQNSDGTDSQKQDDKKNFGNENFDKNDGEGKQSSNSLSKETIILSVASLAVLIVGIVIAFVYKKKN